MAILFKNNAGSTLSEAAAIDATTMVVVDGSIFPAPTPPDIFYATLSDASRSFREVVKVIANDEDTLTVVRGQDGTSALPWSAGARFELLLPKVAVDQFLQRSAPLSIIEVPGGVITLTAEDSGKILSNEGALGVLSVRLPIEASDGTNFTFLSVVERSGISILYPEPGCYISYSGKMGTSFSSFTKGSACQIVKNNESEWTILSTSPDKDWALGAVTENDLSTEILLWRQAVRQIDGDPSMTTLIAYDQFLHSHRHFGTYAKVVDWVHLWKLNDEDEAVSCISLKRREPLKINNGPWPLSGYGYEMDGEAQNVSWPVSPALHGPPIMWADNQRLELYTVFSVSKNAQAIGANDPPVPPLPGVGIGLRPLQGGVMRVTFSSSTAEFTLPLDPVTGTAIGGGLSVGSRNGNFIEGYKNGVFLGEFEFLDMTNGLPVSTMTLGSYNQAGEGRNYVNCAVTYAAFGGRFTPEEEAINWRILSRLIARHQAKPFNPQDDDEE